MLGSAVLNISHVLLLVQDIAIGVGVGVVVGEHGIKPSDIILGPRFTKVLSGRAGLVGIGWGLGKKCGAKEQQCKEDRRTFPHRVILLESSFCSIRWVRWLPRHS